MVHVYRPARHSRVFGVVLGGAIGVAAGGVADGTLGRRFRNEITRPARGLLTAGGGAVGAGIGAAVTGGYRTVYSGLNRRRKKAADGIEKFAGANRLNQDAGDQSFFGFTIQIVRPAREHDDGDAAAEIADAANERETLLGVRFAKRVGKAKVQDYQIGWGVLEVTLGLPRTERGFDLITRDFQEPLAKVELYSVVVNDENAGHLGACLS